MTFSEKNDKLITGLVSGLLLPLITGLIIYFFSPGHTTIPAYLERIVKADILTHSISICVFSNIVIFLIFNRFDMLRATRGVLTMTIIWAVIVFGIKFLT
jgi:hypothetical protein